MGHLYEESFVKRKTNLSEPGKRRMASGESLPSGRQRPIEGFLIVGASIALLLGFVILKARVR